MKEYKKYIIFSILMLIVAIVYTILIKYVDVSAIGPQDSSVGFSYLNGEVHNIFGYNETFYKISKYLGYVPFLMVIYYLILGIKDFITNRDIRKIDKKLIVLYGFYAVVVMVYILFEVFAINYRPVLLKEELEASYPSTHTLLAVCICGSTLMYNKYFLKCSDKTRKIINILICGIMLGIVICRVISGVHWATDIIGGIIISIFLLSVLYLCLLKTENGGEE